MTYISAVRGLGGGALVGVAATLALAAHGRIAGISGIVGRALDRDGGAAFRRAFLLGLCAAGVVIGLVAPGAIGGPVRGTGTIALAGALVGVGTTLGNGCTSGHGVCGLARGSARSVVAVVTFMAVAALTVAIVGPRS